MPTNSNNADIKWTLVEANSAEGSEFVVSQSIETVGRTRETSICIPATSISKLHAQLEVQADSLFVRDLGSTNGTFVNGNRIDAQQDAHELQLNDLVQFANSVFRVHLSEQSDAMSGTMEEGALPWAQSLIQFDRLVSGEGHTPYYQPIVSMQDELCIAYEMLARSDLEGLENPGAMFQVSEQISQEVALSEVLRDEGAKCVLPFDKQYRFFFNTHPKEVGQPRLVESLQQLRAMCPVLPITIEVHEGAVTDSAAMKQLRDTLSELDMQMAYDDFGAGQARLDELTEAPPDVLKFDIKLIRDIDTASAERKSIVETLVNMVSSLGVQTLAEGIETQGEADFCRNIGFDLAQGYFFGRPAPLGKPSA